MRIGDGDYRPFLLGSEHTARAAIDACPLDGALFVDVLSDGAQPFARLVNAGNARAFDGLAMPPWVQLDCCTLPTAMIGFCAPRAAVDDALFADLRARVAATYGSEAGAALDGYDGPVPLSEYTALPSLVAGTVVGFSLYALVAGAQLGTRTKALALACYGARHQIGVAHYGNRAVRTHAAFGALEILQTRAPPHSRPDDTFVYRVVLDGDRLRALLDGRADPLPTPAGAIAVPVEPGQTARRLDALSAERGPLAIVGPGLVRDGERSLLLVAPLSGAKG